MPLTLTKAAAWSHGGDWLVFQDCLYRTDPGHDWADLYVCRPDGSESRLLTTGQAAWFGATYGGAANPGKSRGQRTACDRRAAVETGAAPIIRIGATDRRSGAGATQIGGYRRFYRHLFPVGCATYC